MLGEVQECKGLIRLKNALKKVLEGSIMLKNTQEGSERFKKAPDSKRRIKSVQEGSQMFKNVKEERIPKGLRVIIDSCFGW